MEWKLLLLLVLFGTCSVGDCVASPSPGEWVPWFSLLGQHRRRLGLSGYSNNSSRHPSPAPLPFPSGGSRHRRRRQSPSSALAVNDFAGLAGWLASRSEACTYNPIKNERELCRDPYLSPAARLHGWCLSSPQTIGALYRLAVFNYWQRRRVGVARLFSSSTLVRTYVFNWYNYLGETLCYLSWFSRHAKQLRLGFRFLLRPSPHRYHTSRC